MDLQPRGAAPPSVHLVIDGAPAGQQHLQPGRSPQLASRTPAVVLDLPPGRSASLYLRGPAAR
ncbi:MAG: hypothetical protein U5M23_02120 [Marinagarivorans sp.]|nr:hypothetical protein [Marinagarivorans sp.]